MISIDMTTTGAAGAAPMPAAVVRPSLRDGAVLLAPTSAPEQGTGLPCTASVVRPWELSLAVGFAGARGTAVQHTTGFAGYAERTTSSTPGAQPPRDLLS
jgi:hypothetical protein